MLFNIVVEMLAILLSWAKEAKQIWGVFLHLVLLVLQYVDDTIIFTENDLKMVKNMKLLLCALNSY